MEPIRVLIVEDSAFMRHSLGRLLGEVGDIEVVGSASNGVEGLKMAREMRPDVITLDVEMPVLDGLAMLKLLMHESPTRVVMLSNRTTRNAQVTLDALEYGAIDFVPKPSGSLSIDISRVGDELVGKIRAAASMSEASFLRHRQTAALAMAARNQAARAAGPEVVPGSGSAIGTSKTAPPDLPGRVERQLHTPRIDQRRVREAVGDASRAARRLVVVASSTGGPSALHVMMGGLPDRLEAALVIVQHMPPGFTASLANRLNSVGRIPCAEAVNDEVLVESEAFVTPGDQHIIASTSGHLQLVQLPPVNGLRPAVDVTLQAVAPIWRERLLCVVLTGMGTDGREGCRAVKLHGGTVVAQDAATSTIYGMPAAVVEAGLADQILPLTTIATAIATWCAAEPRAGKGRATSSALAS
jgi:two-component system chemotaxis response regulator CheB